jgi:DNA-binding NtrC family response regulator
LGPSGSGAATSLLVIDDEPINRKLLTAVFSAEGFVVAHAANGEEGLERVDKGPPALVLLDLRMPGLDGLEVLRRLRARWPALPVIVLTSHSDIGAAVEATRLGAYDFLTRPIDNQKLVLAVRRALEHRAVERELEALRHQSHSGEAMLRLRGLGEAMQRVASQIRSVARSPLTVLLQGETGTGKEVVSRALHQESERRGRAFVAVDCGAIPEPLLESELFGHVRGAFSGATQAKKGLLQLADGGTLFLDEVANFNLSTQAKLLRVIQERQLLPVGATSPIPIDVRIVAATNQKLEDAVRQGLFRQDLYFRLAEFVITLPPLRERPEDIAVLALRFLEEANLELRSSATSLSPEAIGSLQSYSWPGNVRELRNLIRQVSLSTESFVVRPEDLAPLLGKSSARKAMVSPGSPTGALRDIARAAAQAAEKQAIGEALQLARGNKAEAARLLKTDYKTLYLKLRRYGMAD